MAVPRLALFGFSVRGAQSWYWIIAASFLVGAVLALNLIESPTGRALRAIHDSEVAARVLGVDVAKAKLAVFVVSALIAVMVTQRFELPATTPTTIGMLTLWFILGYALYATVLGALAALASRTPQNPVAAPVEGRAVVAAPTA